MNAPQKTYENGATVKIVVLNPSEPCVSLRHVVFNVYDKNGTFAVQLDDQFDAAEIAMGLS
jgi:hypothetical protein